MKEKTKTTKALATALEMEQEGKKFYETAAEKCHLDECRRVLLRLAEDEVVHAKRIETMYAAIVADEGWGEWDELIPSRPQLEKMMKNFAKKYGAKINAATSDLKALRVALQLETDSIRFYSLAKDQTEGRIPKRFYLQLIQEETAHYRTLADMVEYLTNPAAWFTAHEHWGLDGA